jgi:Protein of unknown function (DUF4242)
MQINDLVVTAGHTGLSIADTRFSRCADAEPWPTVANVALFLVFRDLPGITRDQYAAAQRAAADASRRSSRAGRAVSYLGGFFLTDTGRAICMFRAESAADVVSVNEQAGVPATDIVEALDLTGAP